MTTRIRETRRRPGSQVGAALTPVSAEVEKLPRATAEPSADASPLDGVLTAVRELGDAAPTAPRRRRYRLPRWTTRDRRVQRLRGWLSGVPG
ncbi:hypothetical protein [Amycolatopsis speibonae]|uniref:Acyl-CoA carboxylase subunit epsilon n=1 Tax=Amycolatopsis speibonae TaxID=1450224 RepID=A0ABV7PBD9_9PSEU